MSINTVADLSKTPASNTDYLSSDATGSGNASAIDTVRQNLGAIIARGYDDMGGVVTIGGSANAITVASNSTYQTLRTGIQIVIKAASINTSSVTLNLDTLGAKAVRLQGDTALAGGEIKANGYYELVYDEAYNTAAGAWVLKNPSITANTYQPYDTDLVDVAATGVSAFSGLIYGLTLSNNGSDATNDIDIAAGIAMDATNAKFVKLASGLTKRLDAAWAVGTGNGGLDTGAIANTTYHMWLIMRSDTGVVDVLFSASASSPTMPSNYNYKRCIGSIVRTGGSIKAFAQIGDNFTWATQVSDFDGSPPATSAQTLALTVPTGRVLNAVVNVAITDSLGSATYCLVTALSSTDTTPSSSINTLQTTSNSSGEANSLDMSVFTNTSAQVRWRASSTGTNFGLITRGWVDTRGRLA